MTKIDIVEFSDLEEGKNFYANKVDRFSAQYRLIGVTEAPYQQSIYNEKLTDAKEVIKQGPSHDTTEFIWLVDEAEDAGKDLLEYAKLVVSKHQKWAKGNAAIERVRVREKEQIKKSQSTIDMYNIWHKAAREIIAVDN